MSDTPTPPNDFTPDAAASASKKSNSAMVPLIIVGCVGCAGFSVVILGIIAAIALPSFLNKADKAREAEAKAYVGSMMRGQQAYHLENAEFASTIEDLGLGITTDTLNYSYEMVPGDDATSVFIYAMPKEETISGFVGAVFAVGDDPTTPITYTGLCESDAVGEVPEEPPALDVDLAEPTIICPPGSSLVE